ncbi:hypothetical protein HDV06_005667 [Boothiomyces sp. JEL0866]|nr:hypothetical protein HDV06_005667 [Boothiomyces sp. JEL0866]
MRQDNAYTTTAALFLGLALWDISQSLGLLLSKIKSANHTPIWKLASVTWIFITTFFVLQYMILDYITSPYTVKSDFFGNLFVLNFIFIYLTTCGVAVMLMTRIRVFYGRKSAVYLGMMLLFVGTVILKGLADTYGVIVGIDVQRNVVLNFEDHPLYANVPFYFAIGQVVEAGFATIGSIAFLYALGSDGKKSKATVLKGVIYRDYIFRLFAIFGINVAITIFGIVAWRNHGHYSYITHLVNYLPTTAYALQFYTFLHNSYITAKTIIQKKQASHSKQSTNSRNSNQRRMTSDIFTLQPMDLEASDGKRSTSAPNVFHESDSMNRQDYVHRNPNNGIPKDDNDDFVN